MDELRARYLRQQMELGGRELIQSAGPATAGPAPQPERSAASPPAASASPASAHPISAPSAHQPARPTAKSWRDAAPPIPGPGLAVLAPEIGLMEQRPDWPTLQAVADVIAGCEKCFLCQARKHTVPGEGSVTAKMLLVGEGPGQVEDDTGRPFVGRAGELLTQILAAVHLKREDVFIANAVKCRPPQNRKPLPDELAACWPYLERQIELIKPAVLVALGATAAEVLLGTKRSLTELRGKVHSFRGTPLIVTYHPAALLRNPNWKKPAWDDIRIARQLIDRTP